MIPTRLPRPGEVVEPCRLCGAALQLSVENPRRVCAACGEINLPGDSAPPDAASARPVVSAALRGIPQTIVGPTGADRLAPVFGAAAPVVSCVIATIQYLGGNHSRWGWLDWLVSHVFILPPVTVVAFLACAVVMARPDAKKLTVAMFWVLGYVSSAALCVALFYAFVLAQSFFRH